MTIDSSRCQDLERALSLEWLETNGRGGYASGTVAGANTRRYHALLLVARRPPVDRVVLVNHLEESVEAGGQSFPLSTNLYSGAIHPEGYRYCDGFSADSLADLALRVPWNPLGAGTALSAMAAIWSSYDGGCLTTHRPLWCCESDRCSRVATSMRSS